MITLIIAIFIIYSWIEGRREGMYYHYKWRILTENKHDEHLMFSIQRALVILMFSVVGYPVYEYWTFLSIPSMILCFSFMHNGAYYEMRNKLDSSVYREGWSSTSNSTTAKLSLNYSWRQALYIIGVGSAAISDILYLILIK